jgi:predicted aspartyl protease
VRFAFASATPLVLVLSIHAQTMSAHVAMEQVSGIPTVQVSVNGTGPYPFVLDTGANVTVIKPRLLRKLNLNWIGPVTIATSLGDSSQRRTEVVTLGVAGVSVEHVEINSVEGGQFGPLEKHVQGILGENFLKYFDLLIDNDHHVLTLDRSTNLANSVEGEHLTLATVGSYRSAATLDRVVVPLQLPLLARPLSFLLDSGTNTAMLFPAEQEAAQINWSAGRGEIHSLNVTQNCHVERTNLAIGTQTFRGVVLAACEDRTRDKTDTDGLLPTGIFHRLFISHRHKYVIANPHPSLARRSSQ